MKNCLYLGKVIHQRFDNINHGFNYNVLYYFLDVETIPSLFKYPGFLTYNSPGFLSFWRKDYFGNPEESLSDSIKKYIFQQTGNNFCGKIFILTNISYFGFCFNPVSFYYCFSQEGDLKYIISEITNTPWGEKHANLFIFSNDNFIYEFKKDFHVSPFIPMDVTYRWNFKQPGDNLSVKMENFYPQHNDHFFHALFNLKKENLTLHSLTKYFFLYPVMSFKIVWGIYFQALLLFIKKAPFYTHPAKENKI